MEQTFPRPRMVSMTLRLATTLLALTLGVMGILCQPAVADSYRGPVVTVSTTCGNSRSYTVQVAVDRTRKGFRIQLSSGRVIIATRVAPRVYRGTSRTRASRYGGREVTSYLVKDQGVLGLFIRTVTKVRHGQYSCAYTDQVQLVPGI